MPAPVVKDRIATLALVALTLSAGGTVVAGEKNGVEARNKAIVQVGFEAWKKGTGSPFDLLTEDATWTIVGNSLVAKTYQGRDAFMAEVIRPFNARMSTGLKPDIREISADGDRVVIRFDASAMRRDGRPYANTYAWFFKMSEGKVVEATAFFDSIAFDELWRQVSPESSSQP